MIRITETVAPIYFEFKRDDARSFKNAFRLTRIVAVFGIPIFRSERTVGIDSI